MLHLISAWKINTLPIKWWVLGGIHKYEFMCVSCVSVSCHSFYYECCLLLYKINDIILYYIKNIWINEKIIKHTQAWFSYQENPL